MSELTDFQSRLLTIIKECPGIRAQELSRKLWPDSDAHRGNYSSGRGTAVGKGAWLAAGSQVAKLSRLGWVSSSDYYNRGYRLTIKGKEMLEGVKV
jgi:hypothetical protein